MDKIEDFHVWALAGDKYVLTTHIRLQRLKNDFEIITDEIHRVYTEVKNIADNFNISHSTI